MSGDGCWNQCIAAACCHTVHACLPDDSSGSKQGLLTHARCSCLQEIVEEQMRRREEAAEVNMAALKSMERPFSFYYRSVGYSSSMSCFDTLHLVVQLTSV